MATKIYRGEDKVLGVTVSGDGNPIDLDTLVGLVCVLTQKGKVLAKYSVNNIGIDFDPITILNQMTNTGEFEVNFQSKDTIDALVGEPVYAEVKITSSQAGFDDNTFNQIKPQVHIADILDSYTKNISTV